MEENLDNENKKLNDDSVSHEEESVQLPFKFQLNKTMIIGVFIFLPLILSFLVIVSPFLIICFCCFYYWEYKKSILVKKQKHERALSGNISSKF